MSLTLSDKHLTLITRAHLENAGWVDDLIEAKGSAREKVLAALERRGLVEQAEEDGLRGYRLTETAIALVEETAPIEAPVPDAAAVGERALDLDAGLAGGAGGRWHRAPARQ